MSYENNRRQFVYLYSGKGHDYPLDAALGQEKPKARLADDQGRAAVVYYRTWYFLAVCPANNTVPLVRGTNRNSDRQGDCKWQRPGAGPNAADAVAPS